MHFSKSLLFVALPWMALTSCGEAETDAANAGLAVGSEPNASAAPSVRLPPAPPALITVTETSETFADAGGVTALAVPAALPVIDKWIGTLDGNLHVDDSDLIVENLRRLRTELTQPTMDVEAVGQLINKLSFQLRDASKDNDDEVGTRLAAVLRAASRMRG